VGSHQSEMGRMNIEAYRQAQIDLGRERKASALLGALQGSCHGALPDVELVERLDNAGWKALEELAGTRPASPQTRALVIRRLRERRAQQARMGGDPFAGIAEPLSA
jgi:hypothetical protein